MTTTSAVPRTARREPSLLVRFFQLFDSLGVLALLVIVIAVTSVVTPSFFTVTNLTNVLITASILAVTGFGMTLVIAMRGLDLSVGSTEALTACVAASLLVAGAVIPVAVLGAVVTGAAIGLINGVVISRLRIPAFVATLGMMSIVRGVALLYTNGQSVLITNNPRYALLNTGKVLGVIPVPFLIALAVLAVFYLLLRHTPFGRHICAVGGNEQAAIAAGLNVNRLTVIAYSLVGVAAALSGVMLSSQLMVVDGTLGVGFELQAIAIAVLGGTSMSGGSANLPGTMLAAILLATISGALNILKVPPFYQYLALGLLLIFALALDTFRRAVIAKAVLGASR
jgi:ribose transport system permease protein